MRIAIFIMMLLTITGCELLSDEFEAMTLDEFNELKCEWQEPKVSQWFYLGYEGGYHKFVHRDLPGDKLYKIKTSDVTIDNPMHFSSNKTNWRIMPWGPTFEECK